MKHQKKLLKRIRLARNVCRVFSIAFLFGAVFYFFNIFYPLSDKVMAFLLCIFCMFAGLMLDLMRGECEERYAVEKVILEKEEEEEWEDAI